jgi:hypothetical protein
MVCNHLRIVYEDVNIPKLFWEPFYELKHFFWLTHIELLDVYLHSITDFIQDFAGDFMQVLRPIPEDAPVMRIVFPLRFFAIEVS